MKRIFIACLAVFCLFLGATAHPVDQETAKAVAVKFMKTHDLHLAATYQTDKGVPAFYIFNNTEGFVIVSADDCEAPIIGYSREHPFDPNDTPIQMEDYLQDFVARIQYGIDNQVVADEFTARQWSLVKSTGQLNDHKSAKEVAPLITAHWHQGCLYNSLCPVMSGPCGHAEVGCVAVAMAQIMHFWKFPEVGAGSHSYTASTGELLTADYGNTLYNWDLMPDALYDTTNHAEVEAVATLLLHCGIAVNMLYTENGSGAHSTDVPDALTTYFRYSKEMHRESMGDNPDLWLTKLKACLDNGRPVLYSGHGNSGHAFVCDGYDDNDLLHFNWGWGGNGDGYYALGNLNPIGHSYNNSNGGILDIAPNYHPYQITATANPPQGGIVEGNGIYYTDQQCILTAIPAENYEFFYWKQGNQILTYEDTYSFYAMEDVDDIEAVFSLKSVRSITANVHNDAVDLSWSEYGRSSWPVLRQFNILNGRSIATDGHHLFMTKSDSRHTFWKYTMDGPYLEHFLLTGTSGANAAPTDMSCDGTYFYCNGDNSAYLYTLDLNSHCQIATVRTKYTPICSYDSVRDGIWVASYSSVTNTYQLKLVSPTGSIIQNGPTLPFGIVPNGSGFFVGEDKDAHLIVKTEEGYLFDYDIDQDLLARDHVWELESSFGAHIGKYEGQDAMFVCYDNMVRIIKIRNTIWPISHYRLYRSDEKGNLTLLADEVDGSTFTDATWTELGTGLYRYGISSLFGNGNESDILWSAPIPKGNYDIEENEDSLDEGVRKVYENGQIVIIKDGKRYNVTGQQYGHSHP